MAIHVRVGQLQSTSLRTVERTRVLRYGPSGSGSTTPGPDGNAPCAVSVLASLFAPRPELSEVSSAPVTVSNVVGLGPYVNTHRVRLDSVLGAPPATICNPHQNGQCLPC